MTNDQFIVWLDGFMHGKKHLDKEDIALIRKKAGEIFTVYPPVSVPLIQTKTVPTPPWIVTSKSVGYTCDPQLTTYTVS